MPSFAGPGAFPQPGAAVLLCGVEEEVPRGTPRVAAWRGGCAGAAGCQLRPCRRSGARRAGSGCRPLRHRSVLRTPATESGPPCWKLEECLGLLCKLTISFLVHKNWRLGGHVCFANCRYVFPPARLLVFLWRCLLARP